MPADTDIQIQATAPAFLGLQSYTEAQANSFFGRDAEIDNLAKLVLINTLTIVFGKSGTGKTSLLNAGVFPKLRKNYCLPFKIRLAFDQNSPDLITQIKKVLKEEIDKYGFKVQSYPESETIWEYFHKEPLWKTVTPILVFDQFEEMFTLAKTNPKFGVTEMNLFWEELSNLIENTIPEKLKPRFLDEKEKITYNYKKQKVKIVFAFREEYLPEFESIATKIPSIKYSRFRLMPMNGHQAYDVITKTWKDNIHPSEAKQIVSYLTSQSDQESYDLVTVEPSLLSQVCAYIDEKRIAEGGSKVSAELLKKYPKETILRSIYEEAVNAAEDAINPDADPETKIKRYRIKEFLENNLISIQGYRIKYNLSEKDHVIRPGIGVLQTKYLIREDDNAVELTHDVLAPIIKSDREERGRKNALSARFKKALKIFFVLVGLLLLVAGGLSALAYIANQKRIDEEQKASLAIQDRNSAQTEKERLQVVIEKLKRDSAYIHNGQPLPDNTGFTDSQKLQDSIAVLESKVKTLESSITKLNGYIDSVAHSNTNSDPGNGEVMRLKNENLRLRQDSTNLSVHIKFQIAEFKKNKEKNQNTIAENGRLISENERLSKENDQLKKENGTLFSDNDQLKKEIARLTSENDRLSKDNDLKSRIIKELELQLKGLPKPYIADTANSIRLTIHWKGSYKPGIPPQSLNIYMIPDKPGNQEFIERVQSYEFYSFKEDELKKNGILQARYFNGDYYFNNVTEEGKYLVKVCIPMSKGYDKEFDLKKGGNPHLVIDINTPVK